MPLEKEQSSEKIRAICQLISEETLAPAKKEAADILNEAHNRAAEILAEARKCAAKELENVAQENQRRTAVMEASLDMAIKNAIESLRQQIMEQFFSQELQEMLSREMSQSHWVSRLLDALVIAIDKEGIHAELQAILPKSVTQEEILISLAQQVAKKLGSSEQGGMTVGDHAGGVELKVVNRHFTLAVTDEALHKMLEKYAHRDLKEKIYPSRL